MSNNRMYSPDMDNLNHTPSCDIFGYLMASVGVTNNTSEEDVVEMLYKLKKPDSLKISEARRLCGILNLDLNHILTINK